MLKRKRLEKKTPQAFRVRGFASDVSSSNQTPAPVAVQYYRVGEAEGCHLSLMKSANRHHPRKAQGMSTL
jgi:hypothetical protein